MAPVLTSSATRAGTAALWGSSTNERPSTAGGPPGAPSCARSVIERPLSQRSNANGPEPMGCRPNAAPARAASAAGTIDSDGAVSRLRKDA